MSSSSSPGAGTLAADAASRGDAEASSSNTATLQELWASAYEGWIGPPGAGPDEVVYLSPAAAPGKPFTVEGPVASSFSSAPTSWAEATLAVADVHHGVYGITAFNPLGCEEPHAVNVERNLLLEEDLRKLCAVSGGRRRWWRSFGFASDWHEKGFTVAAPQALVVELARKYQQGAIYRFYRPAKEEEEELRGGGRFMRATVPASLPDTEADVPVWPCPRPALEQADPAWTPTAA